MDRKKIILSIIAIILLIIVIWLGSLVFNKYVLKKNFESSILSFADKNKSTIFEINNISLFSSCDAKNKNITASNYTIENLYQYTDIAIFISNNSVEKNLENTFKKLSIENIKFLNPPSSGQPNLYFKSINNYSKSDIVDDNIINDIFDFEITSEDEVNLDNPVLYNNLANPITLSYVNSNIKSDYTITDTSSPITYDGSLLKKCNVPLSSISCKLSFDIFITNNLDQEFKSSIYIDIPLGNDNKTIYDGNINLKQNTNFKFFRYK